MESILCLIYGSESSIIVGRDNIMYDLKRYLTTRFTTSDIQDIRKTLDEVRKDIADGKATEALKAINDMDDKLLVSMSNNPPPMLEKSNDNDNNNK